MPAKTYSAGTIFLQVVPVFGDTMRSIKREAEKANAAWGEEMERGGKEAGQRAGRAMGDEVVKSAKASGEKAGSGYAGAFQEKIRGAIKGAQREIDTLSFKTLSDDAEKRVSRIQKLLDGLDLEIVPDMDDKKLLAKLEFIRAEVKALTKGKHELHIEHNLETVEKQFDKAIDHFEAELKKKRTLDIETKISDRDLGVFEKKLRDTARRAAKALGDSMDPAVRRLKARLESISDAEIGIDISADEARAEIIRINRDLNSLPKRVNVDVDTNTAVASAELLAFRTAVNAVDGKDVDIPIKVKGTGAALAELAAVGGAAASTGSATRGLAGSGDVAANSFRSFNFVLLAVVTILPAMIPMIGALGGGLLALIPILGAVGAGLGTLVLGFSGIGNAVQALGDVQDNAAKDAQSNSQTLTNAAYAVADAERALAEARRSGAEAVEDAARAVARAKEAAADAIEDALERQKDAQEEYRQAVKDVAEAERDLAKAREEGRYELLDLDNQVEQNQIDIGQGVIEVFEAQANFDAISADGSASQQEIDAAALALQEAELQLKELRQEQERLAKEKKKADKEGLEGTNAVTTAQEALTQAVKDQQEAEEAMAEAAEDVAETRADAAEQIADAERNLARTRAAAARQVAEAERNLARAQQAHANAVIQTGELGSASMQKLEQAMDKLGPAGRKFARFIFSLRGGFYRLRDAIQQSLLPPVQRAMETIINKYGPQFQTFAANMAGVMGGLFETLADRMANNPAWQGFFKVMETLGPVLLENFGITMINFLEAFASLMTIVSPYAVELSEALLKISERFAAWMASEDGTQFWTEFMDYAKQVAPLVIDFFVGLWEASVNLAKALAPLGAILLQAFTAIFDFIAGLDPKVLGLIVGAIVALIIAFQVAVGVAVLMFAGMTVFGSTLSTIVFIVLLVVGAIVLAYTHSEKFRKVIDKAFRVIGRAASWMWNNVLKPVFEAWAAFAGFMLDVYMFVFSMIWKVWSTVFSAQAWMWNNVLSPVFSAIIKVVQFLWTHVFKPVLTFIWKAWQAAFTAVKAVWNKILWPILDLIGTVIWKLFKKAWNPAVDGMRKAWGYLSERIPFLWNKYGQPIFDWIVDKALPKVQGAFEKVVEAIGKAWGFLKKYIAEPIFGIVDLILNKGIIAGFNKIANAVGSDPMKPIDLPFTSSGGEVKGKYATGGVLPGYTPGQDVHHFTSPSGGSLHLSGGEAIMRPEWTAAMGQSGVDYWNSVARAEGVQGVKRRMGQAFAKGGIVYPVPMFNGKKPYVIRSAYNLGHDGMDINHPDDTGPSGLGGVVPILSATSGVITTGSGYGDAIFVNSPYGKLVYGHAYPGSRRFRPGESVGPGAQLGLIGTTGNSSAPHLHFGFPGGTFGQAESLLSGSAMLDHGKGGSNPLAGFAKWLIAAARNPLGYVKGLIAKPLNAFQDKFGDNFLIRTLADVPGKLVTGVKDKIISILPGPLKALAGDRSGAKGAPQTLPDGESGTGIGAAENGGYFRGGVLPYNGTMKYDSGGYLPPGITSVVNLTGRPEPVLTADQFDGMGGASGGETFHYEPHFEGSDLTAADVVRDMDHARRRMRREGRYARNR